MKPSISKSIVILARSRMGRQLAKTEWGTFATVEEAQTLGEERIKTSSWLVAEEIKRVNSFGEETVEYQYLTKLQNA